MKEVIEDHRTSLDREPRSIYGKLLSSADRNIDVDDSLKRIYLYSITHFNKLSKEETIEECYKHALERFGNDGYANFFVEDKEYNDYLKELCNLLTDKKDFIERLKKIITKINKKIAIYFMLYNKGNTNHFMAKTLVDTPLVSLVGIYF